MKRTIIVTVLLAAIDGLSAPADEEYRAKPNPPTDGRVGANYTPAYAVNQVQFWHDFRPEVVEKELAAARRNFGISTLRVYLHDINFNEEKEVFLSNLEKFLTICEKHGIQPGLVFFDDCHRDDGIFLDRPTTPMKGFHNGRWARCPQKRERDPADLEKFKPYIQEVIRAHRADRRVLFWEVFNEPAPGAKYSRRLSVAGYRWAKELNPVQPVLNCHLDRARGCWSDTDVTDIVDAHIYRWDPSAWDRLAGANRKKGTVFTEAGARWYAPRRSNGEPCEVLGWLQRRRASGRSTPGIYLCWELMVGNSNCRWYWGTRPDSPEPTVPWCGLMWPDTTPVSLAEAEAIRRYVTGRPRALFFDDFQDAPQQPGRSGWTAYGGSGPGASGYLPLEPGWKMVAGDSRWTDFVLEGRVMLRSEERGNAGLVFRVNDAGPGHDQMRGYYVGLDTRKLYLGKMENNWQPLAEFDLGKLDCKVAPGVWNQIRLAVEGPRIRVWLNRMHPSSDPDRGLRIDVTDEREPILSGAIGVRAHLVPAWFDNIVVLPVDALPEENPERNSGTSAHVDWTQSYDAGYRDGNGAYAGGSEIMHLAAHKGKLYAANGYWKDSRWESPPYPEKQSAQVLRLDSADGRWEVDLDLGRSNGQGLRYMKGNILKSVTFTRDELGKPLRRPQNLLVLASGAQTERQGVVSAWIRDDAAGTWNHGLVKRGSRAGGIRWIPRDMEVHRDQVTGGEHLFLLIGNPGIISGVYDESQPARIRWSKEAEFPPGGNLGTRPLGIVQANGSLFFSAGGVIYRRIDGPRPTYTKVLNLGGGVNTDVGGIRGLTTIANPGGPGDSILFLWAPHGRSTGQVKRLDPEGSGGYTARDEVSLGDLMSAKLGVDIEYTLGAHNNMYPVVHPATGETVHLIGFQGTFQGNDQLRWKGSRLYAGALYAIRTAERSYSVHEVNGAYTPGKPVLVSPRTFARSPFGDQLIFIGGHDASGHRSDDMAWIFKASLDVVLGPGGDS